MPDQLINIPDVVDFTTKQCFNSHVYKVIEATPKPLKILELGTGWGHFSILWALCCQKYGGKILTVDNQTYDKGDNQRLAVERIQQLGLNEFVEFKISNDIDEDFIRELVGREYAIILVDTSHTYVQTLFELVLYEEFLAPGGYLVMHDTSEHLSLSFEKRFEQKDLKYSPYGTREAVKKFLKHFPEYKVIADDQVDWGIMILEKEKVGI